MTRPSSQAREKALETRLEDALIMFVALSGLTLFWIKRYSKRLSEEFITHVHVRISFYIFNFITDLTSSGLHPLIPHLDQLEVPLWPD